MRTQSAASRAAQPLAGLAALGWVLLLALPPAGAAGLPGPDFDFQAGSGPLTVQAGSSATLQLSVFALHGYAGPDVEVSVALAPNGTEGSCFPERVTPTGSCTLTLSTPANLTPGDYPVSLIASNGTAERNTTITMRVLAPLTLLVSFDRSVLLLTPGSLATARLQLTIDGPAHGPLNLSLAALGLPPGVTSTFDPPSATGGGPYNLTLRAAPNVPDGNYSLLVTVSGGGYSTQAPLNLSITGGASAVSPSGSQGPPEGYPGWILFLVAFGTAGAAVAATRTAMLTSARRPRPHEVEDVFLLYRDGRPIFTRAAPDPDRGSDPEVMGSMIVAVQDFARDSFRKGTDVDQMRYGTRSVLLARGAHTILAVTVEGEPPAALHEKMAEAVIGVESQYAGKLEKWDGSRDAFEGLEDVLAGLWSRST